MNYYIVFRGVSCWRAGLVLTVVMSLGLLWGQPAEAGFAHLRIYYNYNGDTDVQLPSRTAGRVLSATTAEQESGEVVNGWVQKFPDPDVAGASQYFVAVAGQGLVKINPQDMPEGLTVDSLVGQYVVLGDVEGEKIIAPAPPPTDPLLIKQADVAGDQAVFPLPPAGVVKGLAHALEIIGENMYDAGFNLFDAKGAPRRALGRAAERVAEAKELVMNEDAAALATVEQVAGAMEEVFQDKIDDVTTRDLEKAVAGMQVQVDNLLVEAPEGNDENLEKLRDAIADGVDLAADSLDRPPVTPGTAQGLQSLINIGVLQKEQAESIFNLKSRQEVRAVLKGFVANGYLTKADVKEALDEAANVLYPQKTKELVEVEKLQALNRYETVKPDDATLAKLQEFSATFVPGVTRVPPELMPYWVAAVNLDRLQQTIRPDFVSEQALAVLKERQPSTAAKYKELKHRLAPSPDDITALEQARASLRERHPRAKNIDSYLPTRFKRIAGFQQRFGLKEPEGWMPPGDVDELPFAGPGGLTKVTRINQYCSAHDCSNWTPPSGYSFYPPVGVAWLEGKEKEEKPPIFPGLSRFKPPVATYDIIPQEARRYVGPGGCANPTECLEAFREIPPADRKGFFYIVRETELEERGRPEDYETMTPDERRAYWAEKITSGDKPMPGESDLTPYGVPSEAEFISPTSSGNFGPLDQYGKPSPGPGAKWNPAGDYDPDWDDRSGPYYPPYARETTPEQATELTVPTEVNRDSIDGDGGDVIYDAAGNPATGDEGPAESGWNKETNSYFYAPDVNEQPAPEPGTENLPPDDGGGGDSPGGNPEAPPVIPED